MRLLSFILVFLHCVSSFAMNADYSAYMRGGTGTNLDGGAQQCLYNSGVPGNFLRLGNECSFYTELAMTFENLKPTDSDSRFFRTYMRYEYDSLGTRQWETKATRDVNQIEAYVEAGGFKEFTGSVWVGKRFYRDVDVHIFDWYYYAEMSGVGAGIEDIPWGPGSFAIAHIIQANDDFSNTSVGRPVFQALDLRYKNVVLNETNKINFWGTYAWAPRGTGADKTEYVQSHGYSLSTKVNSQVFGGNNNFVVMYGQGAMKDLNLYESSTVPATDDSQNHANTWRIVNDFNHDVSEKWGVMFAFAADRTDTGSQTEKHVIDWEEIGVRPIYFVSDNFQWVFEGGISRLHDNTEKGPGGETLGDRTLSRVTIAPQISMSRSIWGRPVMRAFISKAFWNDANRDMIAANAPEYIGKNDAVSFGYRFEVWF